MAAICAARRCAEAPGMTGWGMPGGQRASTAARVLADLARGTDGIRLLTGWPESGDLNSGEIGTTAAAATSWAPATPSTRNEVPH